MSFVGDPFEASGVVAVPGSNGVLLVDDNRDRHVMWMTFDATGVGSRPVPVRLDRRVPDPEDIATDGTYFYVVGSQSRGGGRDADDFVRFTFDPETGAAGRVQGFGGLVDFLEDQVAGLKKLGAGRTGPLNIEGLTWDDANQRLLLGLRSPLQAGKALVVAMRFVDPGGPFTAKNLRVDSDLVSLDLGGLGIRGLGYDEAAKRVLVIAGAATDAGTGDFRLFEWNGVSGVRPVNRGVLPSLQKPEGIARVRVGSRLRTLVVFDVGAYQFLD